MNGPYPAPKWGDIDAFCQADEWVGVRETDHAFWEKTLANGEVLQTHRSFSAGDEIGEDLFRLILREQLRVNRDEFWQAVKTGKPVDRPVEPLDDAPTYDAWVVAGLLERGYTEAQIHEHTPDEARELLQQLWSQPN